ncbi:hypothetical protein [Coraliomargarita parva]|uniref:hypothetical protein n=1 Tax=Coraliomargarita parva TaxID=3014050 RepID=UPI0022B53B9F|nr:hypothetical protein [Coraliomargarita parva]
MYRFFRRLICLSLVSGSLHLSAADYWLSPDGSGNMDGSSQAHALPKSQLSLTLNTSMSPGDTLYLCSGDYGSSLLTLSSSGSAGSPKQILGIDTGNGKPHFSGSGTWTRSNPDSGQTQVISVTGSYWEVENLELSGVVYAIRNTNSDSATDIHFKDIDIHDVRHGVYVSNLDNSSFENLSVVHYTKHAYRLDQGCDNVSFVACLADMTGGDTSWWDYAEPIPFGFVSQDSGTDNTNLSFIDCVSKNNRRNLQGISYWNGDGFVMEGTTNGVSFDGCISLNNEDAGFDLKVSASLTGCVSFRNFRSYRLWQSSSLNNCTAGYMFRRTDTLPNGVESNGGSGVWTEDGSISVTNFSFISTKGYGAHEAGSGNITLNNSILAFTATDGSFTQGSVTLANGTATYHPGSGTDPDFVNPHSDWDGLGSDMNSLLYGESKGYFQADNTASGLEFDASSLTGYSGQSASVSTATLESNNTAIHLEGNIWRRYPYPYTVTMDTVLRVTVEASHSGEIMAVGLDNNDDYSDSATQIQLGGSQTNVAGFHAWDPAYTDGSGAISYEIPLGEYFTGVMTHLTFVADDDADANADIIFSDIELYEAASVDSMVLEDSSASDYSNQSDGSSTYTLENSGTTLHLEGNIWCKFDFAYTVTANTVLEFTLDAGDCGEILGIGLDSDNDYSDNATNFQLGGSQSGISTLTALSPLYTAGSGTTSYRIQVGTCYTGNTSYLTFIADDDADASCDVRFSGIRVFESPDFDSGSFSDYSSQTGNGSVTLESNDTAVHLSGNIWQKHPFNYTVTADTVLEVTIDASDTGELCCIGFDSDDSYSNGVNTLKLGGSDTPPNTIKAVAPSYVDGEGPVSYVIPLGQFFTGTQTSITLIADDDADASANVTFSNIKLYESN